MKKLQMMALVAAMAVGTVGMTVAAQAEEASDHVKFGIQSFDMIVGGDFSAFTSQDDVNDMLQQLADAGYEGVEWCNFMFGGMVDYMDLDATKAKMDELGLTTTGMHWNYSADVDVAESAAECIERMQALGTDVLIFAASSPAMYGIEADEDGNWTAEQVDEWAVKVNETLDALRTAAEGTDVKVVYHNHADEFLTGTDGRYFLDMINPDGYEIDVYWAAKGLNGSVDAALDYVKGNDAIYCLHMKDGLAGSSVTGEMCGWGKGTFDLQGIIDLAKECGIEWAIVENDNPSGFGLTGLEDALETAAYAAENITF